ncbi:MAG TPA: Hsp20/alpha crystallin family protein [Opitutaceae bacterium]|nr:Hsp20/alpha crystallin family protein [Opitutaceae bacterium]
MKIVRYHQPTASALSPFAGYAGRNPLVAFEREFDRLFNGAVGEMFTLAPELGGGAGARFAVDLYEDKDNTYVRAELPGVDRKAISVEMVNDYLTISGSRQTFGADGKETAAAEFSRSIAIPESVQADKVSAAYENGVLTVTLPKREEAKPRKVSVEVK